MAAPWLMVFALYFAFLVYDIVDIEALSTTYRTAHPIQPPKNWINGKNMEADGSRDYYTPNPVQGWIILSVVVVVICILVVLLKRCADRFCTHSPEIEPEICSIGLEEITPV